MDNIHIHNIRAYGYTGVFPEEKRLGQWFRADVTLGLDLSRAAHSDNLGDTLNYGEAIILVKGIITQSQGDLIEALAQRIIDGLLTFASVEEVRVQLTKVNPPIPDFEGHITVDLYRRRS